MHIFGISVKDQIAVDVWAFFCLFSSILLIYISVFMSILCWFCDYDSSII
jgi:hypothetical protein